MRSYTIAVASFAIDAPPRWTDNLLSHFEIPDVVSSRRGVARRLTHAAVVRLAIIRQLHAHLGIGTGDAIGLADKMLCSEPVGDFESGQLKLSVNRADMEQTVNARLAEALESHPIRRRGRPPGKVTKTTF